MCGNYPMGVTDATIERYFGEPEESHFCGDCKHFNDSGLDVGFCELEFERAYDNEAPDRKEGRWRLAQWAAGWFTENLLYCEHQPEECDDYEEA